MLERGLRIHLLGGFRVWVGDRPIESAEWRLRKARHLVQLLALAPAHRLPREQAIDMLWPHLQPHAAANSLRQTIHKARRILEPDRGTAPQFLQSEGDILRLCPAEPLRVDAEAFRLAADEARRLQDRAAHLAAIELYAGELLPDEPYEDWTIALRELLHESYLTLLTNLARLYEEEGEIAQAIASLQRILEGDPAREEAHVGLMRLYALGGQRPLSLRQYRRLREALRRELEAEPDPASDQLYRDILAHRFPPASRACARLLPAEAPRATRHNLPAPVSSFVGRRHEIAELQEILSNTRLLSLTGVGGCGKTRLAIELARGLVEDYRDGVWLVELAPLTDASLVVRAVAGVFGVREVPGRPLEETLGAHLRDKHLLIVLDNCEHLLQVCAELVDTLQRSAPRLGVLVTSREALRIGGEVLWRVPPLSVPNGRPASPDQLQRFEAVRLFAERACLGNPAFALSDQNAAAVAEVCRRLDGMPLAIELAAARIRVLSAEQIAARLDQRLTLLVGGSRVVAPRHQTLRAVVDWSFNLLSERERLLFARLSAFVGGWTLEAAEAVGAGGDIGTSDVLDLLSHLVDKSLVAGEAVKDGPTRYAMLETLRAYGQESLFERADAAATQRRHAMYYLSLAEQAEPELLGQGQAAWLRRLEREHDNFRAALRWALESGELEAGLRLGGALHQFWILRGYHSEGRRWLWQCLDQQAAREGWLTPEARRARAKALCAAGVLYASPICQDDWDRMRAAYEESLAIWRDLGDRSGIASVLPCLGGLSVWQGEFATAGALLEESVALQRELGNRWGEALSTFFLGQAAWLVGDNVRADPLLADSLALWLDVGDRRFAGHALGIQALVATDLGEYARAWSLFERCREITTEIGDRWAFPYLLEGFAALAAAVVDPERALRLMGAAAALRESTGELLPAAFQARYQRWLVPARKTLGCGAGLDDLAEGAAMTFEEAIEYALAGDELIPARPSPAQVEDTTRYPLTQREATVAALIARGFRNRDIAHELDIGEGTVARHVEHCLRKLGYHSRAQLAVWAAERRQHADARVPGCL